MHEWSFVPISTKWSSLSIPELSLSMLKVISPVPSILTFIAIGVRAKPMFLGFVDLSRINISVSVSNGSSHCEISKPLSFNSFTSGKEICSFSNSDSPAVFPLEDISIAIAHDCILTKDNVIDPRALKNITIVVDNLSAPILAIVGPLPFEEIPSDEGILAMPLPESPLELPLIALPIGID